MSPPLTDNDPTPNPDDLSPAALNKTMRRVLERLKALEAQAIIDTINEHEDRLDTHGERLDTHELRHEASEKRQAATDLRHEREITATAMWREASDKKLEAIYDGIGRLEAHAGTKP